METQSAAAVAIAVNARFALRRFPPRFSDEQVERAFRAEVPLSVRTLVAGGLFTACAAWLSLFLLFQSRADLFGANWPQAEPALFLMALLSAAVGMAALRMKGGLYGLAAVANCGTGFAALAIGLLVLGKPVLALGGVLAVIMYSAAFFRLPLVHASLATLPFVTAFQGCLALPELTQLSSGDAFIFSVLLWCFEAFAIAAAYVNEVSARTQFSQERIIEGQQRELEVERDKSERLLRNVLPDAIARRLRDGEETIADVLSEVTVVFSDLVGFTAMSERISPAELVRILNRIFTEFDALADRHQLEKIKTVGDAYMAAAGSPVPNPDHARSALQMALGMLEVVERLNGELGTTLQIRIGLASGAVVAGVIGRRKFTYDLWGDTVNTAARMESHGLPGAIQVTEATHALLGDEFAFESRGVLEVKGKGAMNTYLLRRRA